MSRESKRQMVKTWDFGWPDTHGREPGNMGVAGIRILQEYGLKVKGFTAYPDGTVNHIHLNGVIKGENLGNINRKLSQRFGVYLSAIFYSDTEHWWMRCWKDIK